MKRDFLIKKAKEREEKRREDNESQSFKKMMKIW
jgi:hypothetical protein